MGGIDEKQDDNGATEPIIPMEFTPHREHKRAINFSFSWLHGFIAAFLLISGSAAFFVLTARSVFVELEPITAEVLIEGGLNFKLGQRYLIRTGSYQISMKNEGYYEMATQLLVNEDQAQTHSFSLRRLPGLISFDTAQISGARVQIDGIDIGLTPLVGVALEAGEHQLAVSKDRHLEFGETIEIEGRSVKQEFDIKLDAAWAMVSIRSQPAGADVLLDGETIGTTPINAEILQGSRNVVVKLGGHKAWQQEFDVIAGEDFTVSEIELEPADGLVFIRSRPSSASVTIGGEFKGLTPLEVALAPDIDHELSFFKNGYHSNKLSLRTQADQERELSVELEPVMTSVSIFVQPEDAELFVNGESRGLAKQTIELMAASQQIEIRRSGYVPYTTEFTSRPGLDQEIRVTLKSLEEARQEQIKPMITSAVGQSLKLFYPGSFTMGASRREAGRRPNESLREINLEKPFYLSLLEVSNAEFRMFKNDHSSGTLQGLTLDNEAQPVVRVSWNDAALFCNWLSDQQVLPNFYLVADGEVVGFNPESTGYRLPSEAEWAWAAKVNNDGSQLKYSWGEQLPPAENSGNFADISSQSYLGEIIFNYNDGYLGTAAVGSYIANHHQLFDMAGNVAEWVHDYYGSVGFISEIETDPLGPKEGQFHTIRGSSWAHGTITELRLSFRDFGEGVRDDVGFRVARYLEK